MELIIYIPYNWSIHAEIDTNGLLHNNNNSIKDSKIFLKKKEVRKIMHYINISF